MKPSRNTAIQLGFEMFRWTGFHRVLRPLTQGRGAILTFHRVLPARADVFSPNRALEITPRFLDTLLTHLRRQNRRVVPLDAVPALLASPSGPPFVVLTFDDGYRDNLDIALPILEQHRAPFTLFATTGFLDRSAPLWWVDLEAALARLSSVTLTGSGPVRDLATRTSEEKRAAFTTIVGALANRTDAERQAAVASITTQAGLDSASTAETLCLDWDGLAQLAAHPLATVGCHTLTHPRLARLPLEQAAAELSRSRELLEMRLGRPVRHLAFPYGDADAAGPREFALARDLGFVTALTTRPGVLFPEHGNHLTALPRLSVNGLFQSTGAADVLLSGAATAVWNRGRRVRLA